MGCDIHIIVERQKPDASWERVWLHDWDVPDLEGTPDIFRNRNYDLFGILADVRNGTGFAGCVTGSGWPSIAPDRGIPSDSTVTDEERDDYTIGDHSFTWVSLDELKAFDWDGTTAKAYGIVEREEWARMQRENESRPRMWCGGISGAGVVVATPDSVMDGQMAMLFTHVRIEWQETAREATGDWPGTVLPWLDALAAGQPLRLVFGFDS
jgi:hypothetical protein